MQFANYNAFRASVLQLIEGEDLADSSFPNDSADLMIALGENRAYRDLRASSMLAPLSQPVTANAADLPADLIELNEAYFSGERPLEIVALDRLRRYVAAGFSSGTTRWAAQDGDTLTFWPEAAGTVIGSYYAKPAALESITWADATTFARYPEPFLWAALVACARFLGQTDREQGWERQYELAIEQANHDERMRVFSGSALRVRAG